jgi:hypothetical protein
VNTIPGALFTTLHFLRISWISHNKLECYIIPDWKALEWMKILPYCAHLYITKKLKCCEKKSRGFIHNTTFSLYLMNGPNKLKCYITPDCKALQWMKILAFWANTYVTKIMKCCEHKYRDFIQNTIFSSYLANGPNKLECYIIPDWKALRGWKV